MIMITTSARRRSLAQTGMRRLRDLALEKESSINRSEKEKGSSYGDDGALGTSSKSTLTLLTSEGLDPFLYGREARCRTGINFLVLPDEFDT